MHHPVDPRRLVGLTHTASSCSARCLLCATALCCPLALLRSPRLDHHLIVTAAICSSSSSVTTARRRMQPLLAPLASRPRRGCCVMCRRDPSRSPRRVSLDRVCRMVSSLVALIAVCCVIPLCSLCHQTVCRRSRPLVRAPSARYSLLHTPSSPLQLHLRHRRFLL